MRFGRSIKYGLILVGPCITLAAISRGADCPRHPSGESYRELCARSMAPVLSIKPQDPVAGDTPVRSLRKLRHASALRRLAHAVSRVEEHQIPPERLIPALRDVSESQSELSDDPTCGLTMLHAHFELTKLIEAMKQMEAEVGRAAEPELEDARYNRLDAELRLAQAKAALARGQIKRYVTLINV
jgi:hypothetical protein